MKKKISLEKGYLTKYAWMADHDSLILSLQYRDAD